MGRPLSTEPSARQLAILRRIAQAVADGEVSPSYKALAIEFGTTYASNAQNDTANLERLGLLGRTDAAERFLVPTSEGWRATGIEPPIDAAAPKIVRDEPIAAAVREAFAAGEPLPERVVAALEVA